jgi:hypothetical protein
MGNVPKGCPQRYIPLTIGKTSSRCPPISADGDERRPVASAVRWLSGVTVVLILTRGLPSSGPHLSQK